MMAAIVISMITAELAPIPIWFLVNVYEYMNVAGKAVAFPGPPFVSAMTRSYDLMAMCASTTNALRKIGRNIGMMIL